MGRVRATRMCFPWRVADDAFKTKMMRRPLLFFRFRRKRLRNPSLECTPSRPCKQMCAGSHKKMDKSTVKMLLLQKHSQRTTLPISPRARLYCSVVFKSTYISHTRKSSSTSTTGTSRKLWPELHDIVLPTSLLLCLFLCDLCTMSWFSYIVLCLPFAADCPFTSLPRALSLPVIQQ